MTYKISFTRLATYDLDEIIDYISLDNIEIALKFSSILQEIIKKSLWETPNIGVKYKSSRYLVIKNYIVVYDVDESAKTVYIILVSEPHRQWKEILETRA